MIKVSFIVRREGQITALNATPRGAAAQCAIDRVKGTTFRKRAEPTGIDLTVK